MSDSRVHVDEQIETNAIRFNGRLMVPACMDCEEPSKCAVIGCAAAGLARIQTKRCRATYIERLDNGNFVVPCQLAGGHEGRHVAGLRGNAKLEW